MFWTLAKCLGSEFYDKATHRIWVKIFSTMLNVVVPIAVHHELEHREELAKGASRLAPSYSWRDPADNRDSLKATASHKPNAAPSKKAEGGWLRLPFTSKKVPNAPGDFVEVI